MPLPLFYFSDKDNSHYVLSFWEKPDASHTVVRFATSWATAREDVLALGEIL